jgi:NADPH:quinone reductase-like Zn-dependent oxidoreductase
MKKYILRPGEKGIDALQVREMNSRQLKPDEVCVRVRAVSLNYRDLINANRGVKQELVPL